MTPTPKLIQISAWSYSRHQDYSQCPAKAKYKIIDRLKEPDNAAMANGSKVHEEAAAYVGAPVPGAPGVGVGVGGERAIKYAQQKQLVALPISLIRFADEFEALRNQPSVRCEDEWAFDKNWERVDWFASTAWCRIKVDAVYLEVSGPKKRQVTTVHIIDYKTGRENAEHALQRSLYALGAFLVYPNADFCIAEHWYLDAGTVAKSEFQVSDLPNLQTDWLRNVKPMLEDTLFAPTPGNWCRWCWFRKSNSGPCKF